MRKRLFPAVLFSFILVLVSGYFLIPLLIEYKIRTVLSGLEEDAGITALFSRFRYGFFSSIEIGGLAIETTRGISAEFEKISLLFDPLSFLTSAPFVREIDISGGLISIDPEKAKRGKNAGKEGKTANYLQRVGSDFFRKIPRIEKVGCSSLYIVFSPTPDSNTVLAGGEFYAKDVSLERGRVKLEGAGSFQIPEEENLISGEFFLEMPGFYAGAEIRFGKRLVINAGDYIFGISGLSFESGTGLKFLSPIAVGNFPVNGLKEIEAEEISIASLKIGDILRRGRLPEKNEMEIEVTKPLIRFSQASGEEKAGKDESDFGIEGIITAPLKVIEKIYALFPFKKLKMKNARLGIPQGVKNDFFSIYIDLEKSAQDKRLGFSISFETPESGAELNIIKGIFFKESGDYQIDAKIDNIQLYRFKDFLPNEVVPTPNLRMRKSDLTILYNGAEESGEIKGELFFSGLNLNLPYVALEVISDLSLGIAVDMEIDSRKKELKIPEGRLYLNDIVFNFGVAVRKYDKKPEVELSLKLPRTNCVELVRSIPKETIRTLEGIKMSGSFAFDLSLWFDSADYSTLKFSFKPDLQDFHVLDMGKNLHFELIKENFIHRIETASGKTIFREIGPGSPDWVPLDRIAECLPLAVTTTEDASFFKHFGFSLSAIRRSLITNLEKGGFYQGASTISQQLVKNLFLSREKTLSRKLQEIFITWQLERFISKERILELYFNVIEWGDGVYGIKNAARHYFGKEPSELNFNECAFLVAILPAPMTGEKEFAKGRLSPSWRNKIMRILKIMYERGKITEDQFLGSQPYDVKFAKDQEEPKPEHVPEIEFEEDE